MNLEPEADDLVARIGEDNAIKYSIAISLKRIADTLVAIDEFQRNDGLPALDIQAIASRVRKGLE